MPPRNVFYVLSACVCVRSRVRFYRPCGVWVCLCVLCVQQWLVCAHAGCAFAQSFAISLPFSLSLALSLSNLSRVNLSLFRSKLSHFFSLCPSQAELRSVSFHLRRAPLILPILFVLFFFARIGPLTRWLDMLVCVGCRRCSCICSICSFAKFPPSARRYLCAMNCDASLFCSRARACVCSVCFSALLWCWLAAPLHDLCILWSCLPLHRKHIVVYIRAIHKYLCSMASPPWRW